MIVLGIDPGSHRTGWGVIEVQGSRLRPVALGTLRATRVDGLERRLAVLQAGLEALLDEHLPEVVGMEAVFHGPNVRSLVTLGQARGALLAAVGARELPLVELSPAEVKKGITGNGAATKEQVEHMVAVLLGPELRALAGDKRQLDATDALAVAVAAVHRRNRRVSALGST